jgi:photosystem II stability/assembly factor-like uncharacterized protein
MTAGICLILLAAGSPLWAGQAWTEVSDSLLETLAGYEGKIPGARGIGGIAVDRHSGDLIVCLNGPPWGAYRSSDAGETWKRIDDGNVAGGWIRSHSIQIDQDKPGRMAFFRVSPPAPPGPRGRGYRSISAMTTDGGKTWNKFGPGPSEGLFGLAGWTHGMVDWSREDVSRIVAQNRVRPQMCLSTDAGETFEPLHRPAIIEMSWNHELARAEKLKDWRKYVSETLTGYGIGADTVLMAKRGGIEVSTDAGEEFRKVSEEVVTAYTPVRLDGKLYWGGARGVLVSSDQGRTWKLLGTELPMIRKGPMFGANADEMVVVTEDGVYRTTDACRTWTMISDLYRDPTAWRNRLDEAWLRHDYAWDHTRKLLYVAGMAGTCYAKEIEQ